MKGDHFLSGLALGIAVGVVAYLGLKALQARAAAAPEASVMDAARKVASVAFRPAYVRNQPARRDMSEPAINAYGAGVSAAPAPLFLQASPQL